MSDELIAKPRTLIGADDDDWFDFLDVLWVLHHKALRWDAPKRAARYKAWAQRIERHLYNEVSQ